MPMLIARFMEQLTCMHILLGSGSRSPSLLALDGVEAPKWHQWHEAVGGPPVLLHLICSLLSYHVMTDIARWLDVPLMSSGSARSRLS